MSRNTTIAFSFFAVIYVALQFVPDLRVHWMFKIFPIVLLLIEVSQNVSFKHRQLLLGALVASAAGDILLHFDLFIPGLSAFLIAQIQYAIIFYQFKNIEKGRTGLTLILALYLIGMSVLLYPNLDDLLIPVFAYLIVITSDN